VRAAVLTNPLTKQLPARKVAGWERLGWAIGGDGYEL